MAKNNNNNAKKLIIIFVAVWLILGGGLSYLMGNFYSSSIGYSEPANSERDIICTSLTINDLIFLCEDISYLESNENMHRVICDLTTDVSLQSGGRCGSDWITTKYNIDINPWERYICRDILPINQLVEQCKEDLPSQLQSVEVQFK